jgi:hypothetical protein
MKIIILGVIIIVLVALLLITRYERFEDMESIIVFGSPTEKEKPKIFWTYWDNDIPDTIKKCIATWTKHNSEYKTIILNRDNLHLYCDDDIYSFPYSDNPQRRSDFVRLAVLSKHGGTWIDSSSIMTEPIQDQPYEYVGYYINGFTEDKQYPVIENWFISCVKNCQFIKRWKDIFYSINEHTTVLGYLLKIWKTTDFQNISTPWYLTMHIAAQYVLQNENVNTSMYLMKAEDGPLKYLDVNNWKSEQAIDSLIRGENITPLIKFRGDERKIIDKK